MIPTRNALFIRAYQVLGESEIGVKHLFCPPDFVQSRIRRPVFRDRLIMFVRQLCRTSAIDK